jgi:MarR family transcriptional regulator, organic hydroperoxide resistance regulator
VGYGQGGYFITPINRCAPKILNQVGNNSVLDHEKTKPYLDAQKRENIKTELMQVWKNVGHKFQGCFSGAWLELNLTISQFKCLVFIDIGGSTNQKNLAAALGVTPPNVTGIIDRLVEQELVSRHENENNRRMQVIELTPKSQLLLSELKTRNDSLLASQLDSLKIEDLEALLQGMKALGQLESRSSCPPTPGPDQSNPISIQ